MRHTCYEVLEFLMVETRRNSQHAVNMGAAILKWLKANKIAGFENENELKVIKLN